MIFSEKLQLIRKNKGLTQEELAEKLSVSRQVVAKWESGAPVFAIIVMIPMMLFGGGYGIYLYFIYREYLNMDKITWHLE